MAARTGEEGLEGSGLAHGPVKMAELWTRGQVRVPSLTDEAATACAQTSLLALVGTGIPVFLLSWLFGGSEGIRGGGL